MNENVIITSQYSNCRWSNNKNINVQRIKIWSKTEIYYLSYITQIKLKRSCINIKW